MSKELIRLRDLCMAYDDELVLDHLNLYINDKEFLTLLGPSGCGKSTILRLTCGLLRPKAGTIRVNGRPIAEQSHYCGYMPQRDLLFPWRTVGENLALEIVNVFLNTPFSGEARHQRRIDLIEKADK